MRYWFPSSGQYSEEQVDLKSSTSISGWHILSDGLFIWPHAVRWERKHTSQRAGWVSSFPSKTFYCPPSWKVYPVIWLGNWAKNIHCISSGSSGGIQRTFCLWEMNGKSKQDSLIQVTWATFCIREDSFRNTGELEWVANGLPKKRKEKKQPSVSRVVFLHVIKGPEVVTLRRSFHLCSPPSCVSPLCRASVVYTDGHWICNSKPKCPQWI